MLPSLGAILTAIQDEVTWGRGFALIRGVPVDRYTRKEALIAYWGIGLYWGKAVPQNKKVRCGNTRTGSYCLELLPTTCIPTRSSCIGSTARSDVLV